jgi:uncharacterized RDD family membrane protein YckC
MTREEHLSFCKICKKHVSDRDKGVICELTNQIADFEMKCDFFEEDIEVKKRLERTMIEHSLFMKTPSQGKRFANYILDIIFFYLFCFLVGVSVGALVAVISPSMLSNIDEDNKILNYLIGFVMGMFYYSTFEAVTGRTLAKFITKTKVVDDNGDKPSYGTILLRSLCRFIPFEPLSFLGSDGSGWHDKLSGTRVVEV